MANYEELSLRFTGVAPLLMRAGHLADPLNEHAVALHQVTSKRQKSASDHRLIARLEWRGSLWLAGGRPCVPAEAIEAAMVAAGKSRRFGTRIRAGVFVRDSPLLQYDGPDDIEALFEEKNFVYRCGVRINTARTMRTRPRFNTWAIDVTLSFLPAMINRNDLQDIAGYAGEVIGIGDYRPRFGRFLAEPVG